MGPDADDPELTLDAFRARIRRHPGELKSLLRNQHFVAGIGNAYSDEILWTARLAPLRKRRSLSPEEVDRLYEAMRSVLADATAQLRDLSRLTSRSSTGRSSRSICAAVNPARAAGSRSARSAVTRPRPSVGPASLPSDGARRWPRGRE